MFEKASRLKLRFETSKGQLAVEDLWDLPLTSIKGTNLDDLARQLHQLLESSKTISFVTRTTPTDELTKLKFDIVVQIINTKVNENQAAAKAKAVNDRKQQIMALIEQKQNEQLSTSSIEDLRAMLETM